MTVFSTTAFAQVKTMSDGTQFDAEYYAAQNPDVVAACGNNETALFQHYVQFGKAEGRAPFANGTAGTPVAASANSIKDQVAALGITYDPSRDSQINLAGFAQRPFGKEFTRGDYTNDPLYYEFAKEFVSNKGLVRYNDYVGKTYFGDKDLTYLTNVLSNLYVDYVESKLCGNAQAVNGGLSGIVVANDFFRELGIKWNYGINVKLPN
jgi:hypothetical protein